ncbi:MAG: hypothetical protein ACKESB_03460 [Candidatus Hodgkinia cicadicola]
MRFRTSFKKRPLTAASTWRRRGKVDGFRQVRRVLMKFWLDQPSCSFQALVSEAALSGCPKGHEAPTAAPLRLVLPLKVITG